MSDKPRKERNNIQGWELELKQRNSCSCKDRREQAGLRADRKSLQSAGGDRAICCISEVIKLTEDKHRRKGLSARAKWGGGKYQLALFYYSILPSYIAFSLFWKLIILILIKADFLSSEFCDLLGAVCNKKVLPYLISKL